MCDLSLRFLMINRPSLRKQEFEFEVKAVPVAAAKAVGKVKAAVAKDKVAVKAAT